MKPIVIDAFCGQGGAGMGYSWAGFEVIGIDITPQPCYPFGFICGDALVILRHLLRGDPIPWDGRLLWLRDIAGFHGSPPCQRYSDTQRIQDREHPDLIAPIREIMQATGLPYVIENVPGARAELRSPVELCGAMFGLRTYRHRLFETSFPVLVPGHPPHIAPQAKMGRPVQPGEFIQCVGNFSDVPLGREAMQMPWATREGLREAIPPAYTEHIGRYLMAAIEGKDEPMEPSEMPYKRNGCDLCGRMAPLSRIELEPGNREKLARVAYVCDQHQEARRPVQLPVPVPLLPQAESLF